MRPATPYKPLHRALCRDLSQDFTTPHHATPYRTTPGRTVVQRETRHVTLPHHTIDNCTRPATPCKRALYRDLSQDFTTHTIPHHSSPYHTTPPPYHTTPHQAATPSSVKHVNVTTHAIPL